jgi:DNA repair exonuclease SbcCD ATPase subunit
MLFPAVALVAQTPAPVDLAQVFNAELPGINQMLKEFKTQEALAKVQSLIPATRPVFEASSPKAIGQSLDNAQGLMSLYRLQANVASEAGLWEKAVEIQEKRAQDARATLADLEKAQAPIAALWTKVTQDSGDYIAKNGPRQLELQATIKALKAEVEAVNNKQKKLDSKGTDELKARIAKSPQDEQELAQINAALPVHKQNLANAPKVLKMLADNRKEVEGMIKSADEAVAKAKLSVTEQNDEITKFNTEQVVKKVKVVGRKTWVDAVMRNHDNVTKLGTPQVQVAFLNRLLVLDPGNTGVEKALENIKAGKDAFPPEVKPAKKAVTKKK